MGHCGGREIEWCAVNMVCDRFCLRDRVLMPHFLCTFFALFWGVVFLYNVDYQFVVLLW